MKVKDFLNWLKENNVNEDSEIEITRFFDNDIVAYVYKSSRNTVFENPDIVKTCTVRDLKNKHTGSC